MTQNDLPTWRLRPKTSPQRFRRGDPWIFADELVMDRRTKATPAGGIVVVQDTERQGFAVAAVNPASKIAARILSLNPEEIIDAAWIEARLARALALRERLFDQPFYRLVHAEADGMPGVIIDRFGDVAVIQPNAAWADAMLAIITDALMKVTGVSVVHMNGESRARALEELPSRAETIRGTLPAQIDVLMNGATYVADLADGQKTGLFFDQRDNHAFAARLAKDARVLDVFSHVGGFGLAALAGGAASALAIDSSAPALALAEAGAEKSGFSDRFSVRKSDAVPGLKALASEEARFDLVIADPPAFAPHKGALENGLRGYERVALNAAPLVETGGYLVLCSCSQAADLAKFREASLRGIGRARRRVQLVHTGYASPDHPVHSSLADSAYLKALFFRVIE